MRTLKLLVALIVVAAPAACGSPDDDGSALDTLAPPPTAEVQDPPPPGDSTSTSDVASGGPDPSTTNTTIPLGAPSTSNPGRGSPTGPTGPTGATAATRPGGTTETTRATGTTAADQASTTTRAGAITQPSGTTVTTSPTTATTAPKRAQTISFGQPPGPWVYDEQKLIVASASSGLPVTYEATGACVVDNALLGSFRATNVGACKITASQNGDAVWKAAPPETLSSTISKATPVIAGFTNQVREYPQEDFSFPLTAASYPGAVIAYSVVEGNVVCTLSGGALQVTIDPSDPPSLPYTCGVTADVRASQLFEAGSATARFTINPTVLDVDGSAVMTDSSVTVHVTLNRAWGIFVYASCGSPPDRFDGAAQYSFSFAIAEPITDANPCTISIETDQFDGTHNQATVTITLP